MKQTDLLFESDFIEEASLPSTLNAILNSITEGFFLLDTHFNILLLNKQGSQFIKKVSGIYPKKGDNILNVIPAESRDPGQKVLIDVLKGVQQEYDIKVRVNDKIMCFTISYSPIISKNFVSGICITVKDITEKKNVEYRLRKSEEKFKAIFNSAFQFIGLLLPDGKLIEANKPFLNFTGISPEAMLGKYFWDCPCWSFSETIQKQLKQAIHDAANGSFVRFETQIPGATGSIMYIDFSLSPIKNDKGEIIMLVPEGRDITELRMAKERLKILNERFVSFMDNTSTLAWIIDDQARFRYINKPYMRAFNLDEKAIGKSIFDIFPKEICDSYVENNNRVWETGNTLETIEEGLAADGSKLILQIFKFPLASEGNIRLLGGSALDITQLHNAKEELSLNNERYYYADRATSDAIWDWNISSNKIVWGEAYSSLFGHSKDNLSFEFIGQFLHPDDKENVLNSLEQTLAGINEQWTKEYRFRCGNGSYKYVLDKGYIIRNDRGEAIRMIGAMKDITEQRFLEKVLAEDNEQRQKEIMKAVMDAQENERSEVSFELHESVNQILASSKLMLGIEMENQKANPHLSQASENIQKAMDEIRNISYRLNPSIIQLAGLNGALSDLASKTKAAGVLNLAFQQNTKNFSIPFPIQITVFRIVQAQLDNIIKHAQATEAKISLEIKKNMLILKINDNGIGFDQKLSPQKLGLQNIFNRVHFHDGKVFLRTAPGHGCLLEVHFYLDIPK
ncbi:MAG: PAS domain S-box protein [Chitinophagaceae bacterium]